MDGEIMAALEAATYIFDNNNGHDFKMRAAMHYHLRAIALIEMEKLREMEKQGVTLLGILKVISQK
jgi:hypothetical protein